MSFTDELAAFGRLALQREEAVFSGSVAAVKASIRDGSALTGAPGQPETTGGLRDSWQDAREGPGADVFSNHPAAPVIEAGTREGRAIVLHGAGGGFHSGALTAAGWERIVDAEAERVASA